MDIQKDTYELIKEVTGRPKVATAAVYAGLVILFGTAAGFIGTLFYGAHKFLIRPYVVPLVQGTPVPTGDGAFWTSIALTSATVLGVGYLLYRFSKNYTRWQRNVFESLNEVLQGYSSREELDELRKRVSSLEIHTDIDGSTKELVDLMVRQEMISSGVPVVIDRAIYGIGNTPAQSVDVTETVRGYVVNGRVDMLVNNDTMKVHPFAGKEKRLFVDYSLNGQYPQTVEVNESEKLVLPHIGTMADLVPRPRGPRRRSL